MTNKPGAVPDPAQVHVHAPAATREFVAIFGIPHYDGKSKNCKTFRQVGLLRFKGSSMSLAAIVPELPLALSIRTTDFDELAQGIPGWDVVFNQVSAGAFRGVFDFLKLGGATFCRIEANREFVARGAHRPGTYGFGLPVFSQGKSMLAGRLINHGQAIFLGPEDTLDQKTCADYKAVFVEVDRASFLVALTALIRRDVQADLAGKALITPSPQAANSLATWIHQTLDLAQNNQPLLAKCDVQRQLLDGLLARLAHLITGVEGPDAHPDRLGSRRQLVRQAEALMDAYPDGAMTILRLCQALAVSERSLHYAFEEIMGQTPMAYYRHKRLNAVRRYLKQARPLGITVAEAGHAWGFWHTGQFAADYRRLFGELPSTTLTSVGLKK
jgi:AraC family ethanolamine operon transcriptional activator